MPQIPAPFIVNKTVTRPDKNASCAETTWSEMCEQAGKEVSCAEATCPETWEQADKSETTWPDKHPSETLERPGKRAWTEKTCADNVDISPVLQVGGWSGWSSGDKDGISPSEQVGS